MDRDTVSVGDIRNAIRGLRDLSPVVIDIGNDTYYLSHFYRGYIDKSSNAIYTEDDIPNEIVKRRDVERCIVVVPEESLLQ
jgi:hypothetical protein